MPQDGRNSGGATDPPSRHSRSGRSGTRVQRCHVSRDHFSRGELLALDPVDPGRRDAHRRSNTLGGEAPLHSHDLEVEARDGRLRVHVPHRPTWDTCCQYPHAASHGQSRTNVGKRGNVPTVKTPEERGPRAAWAYEARTALDLSPESVVHALGRYNPATIRKAEADSEDMSAPLWRALTTLYSRLSRQRNIVLGPLPPDDAPAAPTDQTSLITLLTEALARQSKAIEDLVQRLDDLASGQVALAQEVGMALDPERARRRLAADRSGTRSESAQPDRAESKAGK